jgi:signal transduction histidine kinase
MCNRDAIRRSRSLTVRPILVAEDLSAEGSGLHAYVLIPLVSGVAAAVLATAILSRDSSHRAHRLTAAILGCAAYWSFLEVIWNSLDQSSWVVFLIRLSSLGWMPLGVLALHLSLELGTGPRTRLHSWLPALYGLTAANVLLYVATPWGIASAFPTSWGWSFHFGPLFLFQYVPVAAFASISMTVFWRRLHPPATSRNERRQAQGALLALSLPLVTASATDALLPYLGFHVPRLGSASITILGAVVALSTRRYGYSILAPGTYAPQILAALPDGVALLRLDGVILRGNRSLARLCACGSDALQGRPISDFLPDLPVLSGRELSGLECQLVTESGQRLAVSVTASELEDRLGECVGYVLSVRDVRSVVAMRSRLMLSGRLSAVGELAAGIAHEINNPVSYVQANLNQMAFHWQEIRGRLHDAHGDHEADDLLSDGDELIHDSLSGVKRIAAIVHDVRGFANAGTGERSLVDVAELLDSALRLSAHQFGSRAVVERDLAEVPLLSCNPDEIKQVFLDLLMNAGKAIGEGGTIHVQTRLEGSRILVRIQDDGCGMTREVCERIFDPFFTTERENVGLGLSLSYEMVRKHGGDIEVDSDVGRGTCFRVRLPVEL